MLISDFYSDFEGSVEQGDIVSANNALMKELANILVRNRTDFVHLLNESDVPANVQMSDSNLVKLFIDNVGQNKKLALGASILVNIHNRRMGFDGEDEVSDTGVKNGYVVLQEYFSNFGPVTAIAEGIGKGIDLGSKGLEGHQKKKYGAQDALIAKRNAQATMNQQVLAQRQQDAAEKNKNKRTLLIVGGVVLGLAIVAGVIYAIKKRGK
jgi:hypothetical protein